MNGATPRSWSGEAWQLGSYDWRGASVALAATIWSRRAREGMPLDPVPQGQVHLTLEPDQHIFVHIWSAEAILIGSIGGTPGEGPLAQIMPGEPTARLETK